MIAVNGKSVAVPSRFGDMMLLDFIRDFLGLKGTKYGCGRGLCGACTVHVNGSATRSCQTPVSEVKGQRVTTIEGLAKGHAGDRLHPVQEAWVAESVPQCGYCQPGQIMTAAAFLRENPSPSDAQVRKAMDGNLCRCGTYERIRRAVRRAAENG